MLYFNFIIKFKLNKKTKKSNALLRKLNYKIMKIFNPSATVSIDISLDGVIDHDFIPPGGTLIVDFQTNHYEEGTNSAGTLNVAQGQILYGKTAANPAYLQIVGYR